MTERLLKRAVIRRLFLLLTAIVAIFPFTVRAGGPLPLKPVQAIALTGVKGRIDHMAVDIEGQRLFVAALGNNTVEVIDLSTARHIRTIRGLREPQGILFLPEFHRLFVANGKDGTCMIFDGGSLSLITTLRFSGDADNIRYDQRSKLVYVGYGNGALAVIDPKDNRHIGDIRLAGHPESFLLEAHGTKIYVNVPDAGHVAVADRVSRSIVALWPLGVVKGNFPMALDEADKRLLIGCRDPSVVLVIDIETGVIADKFNAVEDIDDIFYDQATRRVYASGGGGFFDIFEKTGSDRYSPVARIKTPAGARTSLVVPELNRLYLAVPGTGKRQAEVLVYELGDMRK